MHIIVNNVVSNKMYRNGIPMWDCGWKEPRDFNTPFYIEDISGSVNTLSIVKSADGNPTLDIEYSTDLNTWNTLGSTSLEPLTLTIPANSKVYLRCNCDNWNQNNISCSGNHNVGGNVCSLLYGSSFDGQTSTRQNKNNAFRSVMKNNTHVVDASKLILPATIYGEYTFDSFFFGCTALTRGPYMPATTIAAYSYQTMFKGCTSLTVAPELPVTKGTWQGCRGMYEGCTALVNPPVLVSEMSEIAYEFFENMFKGCTSLVRTPAIKITGHATASVRSMFEGCTSLVDASGMVLEASNYSYYDATGMFKDCTSLTKPPTINIGTMDTISGSNMFKNCTSLRSIILNVNTIGDRGFDNAFYGCTSLSDVTCYATSGFNNCGDWMKNVAATGIFRKPAEATGWSEGASGIPTGWTVVDL